MVKLNQLAVSAEGFVFDPTTGESFTVNATGLAVLNLLRDGKSADEIVAALEAEFAGAPFELRGDVTEFVERMRAYKLL